MIAGVFVFYIVVLAVAGLLWKSQSVVFSRGYLTEVNRVMKGMEERQGFSMPDLSSLEQIESITFLASSDMDDVQKSEAFFQRKNAQEAYVEPLIVDGNVLGWVRFGYRPVWKGQNIGILTIFVLLVSAVFVLTTLVYVRNRIIKPFLHFRDVPYEMAKGRLQTELEENKNRFFGKFVWGISMLRDELTTAQKKALKLEKEKKLLMLSLSHDIKTPLNNIKLYTKALQEGLYDSEERKKHALWQIERLSEEIDGYVKEIVRTSSEELFTIEVENTEFYLKELVTMIKKYYETKCRLLMVDFSVERYDDKLLCGDRDRAFEVVGNIIENALKYGDGREITLSFSEEEGCQLLQIHNTGAPVKTEEMPHLFDSFYRGSNVGIQEGSGLGLYICRELMRKMEGEIFAEAEPDGMRFVLVFQT